MKPCLTCGTLTRGTRCPTCHSTRETRLYGPTHRAARKRWQPLVDTGRLACAKRGPGTCNGELLVPGQPWDLDHRTGRPCHPSCNRSARGERG